MPRLTIVGFAALSIAALPQVTPKNVLVIHVSKIKRAGEGCTVEAESTTVRFQIASDMSSACGMLHAGEAYKAFRAMIDTDPKDESKDSAVLVIYNNRRKSTSSKCSLLTSNPRKF